MKYDLEPVDKVHKKMGCSLAHYLYYCLKGKNAPLKMTYQRIMEIVHYRTIEATDYIKFIKKNHPKIHKQAEKASQYQGTQ
jgi:hypothetical protein